MCLHGLVHRVRYRDFHCKEKVKVSSQRKSYILTVDVNENESAKNYPSGVTLTESKRLSIKFLMTNFIVDKPPRAKTVD